jgi:hypothetical protein
MAVRDSDYYLSKVSSYCVGGKYWHSVPILHSWNNHLGELEYHSLLVHLSDSDKDLEHVVSFGWIIRVDQTNDKTVDSVHDFRLVH